MLYFLDGSGKLCDSIHMSNTITLEPSGEYLHLNGKTIIYYTSYGDVGTLRTDASREEIRDAVYDLREMGEIPGSITKIEVGGDNPYSFDF